MYISNEVVSQVFGDEPHVYLAYQPERTTLLAAPASSQWFSKMHEPSQHMLKTRNLQGDKTIALHEILIDNDLDNQDRELEYSIQESTKILKITL
ncbi:MAG: hypothetical protein ACFB15_06285 [Cyclobacteriaceae bacterium]